MNKCEESRRRGEREREIKCNRNIEEIGVHHIFSEQNWISNMTTTVAPATKQGVVKWHTMWVG